MVETSRRALFQKSRTFIPERWSDAEIKQLPKFAYFPFGGGPRVCIGSSFAMMEAMLVLATVSQQFRLTAAPGYAVKPWPAITLQPRGGISLRIEKRSRSCATEPISSETPVPRLAPQP